MKQVLIIALILCSSLVSALPFITYASTNVTVANMNGDFTFRQSSLQTFSVPNVVNGVYYSAISVKANANTAQLDGVFGTGYTGLGIPPSFYLSFYEVASNFTAGANVATANMNAAAAFLGKVYLNLEEVNPAGTVVATTQFKNLLWNIVASNMGNGGLRFVAFKGTNIIPSAFSVTINFAVSDVLGVLNVTGAPIITPKSNEIILEIDNYTYASTNNSLRVNIGVATGQATVQVTEKFVTLTSGAGATQTYFQLSKTAQVDGTMQSVTVSSFVDGTSNVVMQNTNLETQATARYAAMATFKIVTVTFPPGAAKIILDPAIGVGSVPVAANAVVSSSILVVPSLLVLLIALIFAF